MAGGKKSGPAGSTRGSMPDQQAGDKSSADASMNQPEFNPDSSHKEFMKYVADSFSSINTKLDSVLTGQAALESKLASVQVQADNNSATINDLIKSVEFNSEFISDHTKDLAAMKDVKDTLSDKLHSVSSHATDLEKSLNLLERHSRSYNVRLLGVPEPRTGGVPENCVDIVETILRDNFKLEELEEHPIENAHRIGSSKDGKPRHIIARFFSRPIRGAVMRAARESLQNTQYHLMDDLTIVDAKEKKRLAPMMQDLYDKGKRPSFRNGRLYSEGKPVSSDAINSFLGKPTVEETN